MVRRFYITGGNNVGDPADGATEIVDDYFATREVTGVFKEGARYLVPSTEWLVNEETPNTITLLNSMTLSLREVIIVEVSEKKNGVTYVEGECKDEPYLPDIIKCVVAKVNIFFENREDDPFSVYYDHGIYEQVGTDKKRREDGYLFVWLVMPFDEERSEDDSYFGEANCKIIIAMPTDNNYTQAQREEINFHPRLIPVYNRLIDELKKEPKLSGVNKSHKRRLLPYWGGGDMMAGGQPNLWKDNVDCIEISNLKLTMEHIKCCSFTSNF